ncbi:nitroreductase family protein [Candidatus Bathyarchaeota archaeon]|nr:nitroreductase family protein [Candidatus Bathyarchaeota archaeon]
MDALEAIRGRRSVRRFLPTTLSREIVETLVDAARHAPSAMNLQPWEFIAVTDQEMRRRIADVTDYGKFIADAPLCIAVFCRESKYYLEDGSAAVENLLIAATALGLGSCWVAGDKKGYAETVRELLSVPAGYRLIALVPVGYVEGEVRSKQKRELREVLHYERFSSR